LLQHVSVHIKPSSGSHTQFLAKITYLIPTYQYWCCRCYDSIIYRHNTDNINNDTHIGIRYVVVLSTGCGSLMMVLCEPKHVGAAFIILAILRI